MTSIRLTGLLTAGAVIFLAPLAAAQGPAPLQQGYAHSTSECRRPLTT